MSYACLSYCRGKQMGAVVGKMDGKRQFYGKQFLEILFKLKTGRTI